MILAAMAAVAGLDRRLTPFIAGYVLILAILGSVLAEQSRWLARGLRVLDSVWPGLLP